MGRCDQGIKICSIFKVLGMRWKQCHCVRLVFLIPAVYLFSRTESIWRRYRDLTTKSNREKFGMLTVPVRTVRMATWRVVPSCWRSRGRGAFCMGCDCPIRCGHVSFLANNVWTCGPTIWRHMSLYHWFDWVGLLLCKMYGSPGFDSGTSPIAKVFETLR